MNISRGLIRNFNTTRNKELLDLVKSLGKAGRKAAEIETKVYKRSDAGHDALMRAALKFESDPKNISLVGAHAAKAKRPEK